VSNCSNLKFFELCCRNFWATTLSLKLWEMQQKAIN